LSDIYRVLRHVSAKLAVFIDIHHVRNSAVYILTGNLSIMAKLLTKFYSVYVFFEGAHLLSYPEPDEFNSNCHTVSLSFILILYCPLLPKKNCIFFTGSCHPYSV